MTESRKPGAAPSSLPAGQELGMQAGYQPGVRELTPPAAGMTSLPLILTIKTKMGPVICLYTKPLSP